MFKNNPRLYEGDTKKVYVQGVGYGLLYSAVIVAFCFLGQYLYANLQWST